MAQHHPVRLIREILHVLTGECKRTDDGWLDAMSDDEFVRARRRATTARNFGASEWTCPACGHPAFPSRQHLMRLRYIRHFAGALADCPWHQDHGFNFITRHRIEMVEWVDRLRCEEISWYSYEAKARERCGLLASTHLSQFDTRTCINVVLLCM